MPPLCFWANHPVTGPKPTAASGWRLVSLESGGPQGTSWVHWRGGKASKRLILELSVFLAHHPRCGLQTPPSRASTHICFPSNTVSIRWVALVVFHCPVSRSKVKPDFLQSHYERCRFEVTLRKNHMQFMIETFPSGPHRASAPSPHKGPSSVLSTSAVPCGTPLKHRDSQPPWAQPGTRREGGGHEVGKFTVPGSLIF